MPTNKAKRDAKKEELMKRREQVMSHRRDGMTLRDIGHRLGVSYQTVKNDIDAMMAMLVEETVVGADKLRTIELERIDTMLRVTHAMINKQAREIADGGMVDVALIDRVLKLSQERSKLLGLYAPTKQEVTGAITHEHHDITPAERRERAMLIMQNAYEIVSAEDDDGD